MKARKVWLVFIALILVMVAGCSGQKNSDELQLGKYVKQDAEGQECAWVLLSENNRFEFNRNNATSYRPYGTYEVKEGTLILTVNEKEVYKFSIDEEKLILEDGIGKILKSGDVFEFTKSDAE